MREITDNQVLRILNDIMKAEDESCDACMDKSDCEDCPFNPEIHEF